MKKAGTIEKLAGHVVTQGVTTLIGALNPAAAILPVLLSSAANARMQERIDEALKWLQDELIKLEGNVARMSDAQYKIVCEALSHLHRTSDAKKIGYLKRAVINGVLDEELSGEKAYIVSRILRDISALEIDFLLMVMKHNQVYIINQKPDGSIPVFDAAAYNVANSIENQMIIAGLLSLGLVAENGQWKTGYISTPVAYTLISMLN